MERRRPSPASASYARRPRRAYIQGTSSQLFPLSSIEMQAIHAEWKQQILRDIVPCLELPAFLLSQGVTLLEAREQAVLEAIDRLIISIFQDVQSRLDGEVQSAREVSESENHILTRQQIAVLEQLSLGQTPKEIARQLGVEVGTIRAHQRGAYARLGVSGRDAAVREARLLGLLFSQNTQQTPKKTDRANSPTP